MRDYTVHTYNEQLADYVYSRLLAEAARRFRAVLAATAIYALGTGDFNGDGRSDILWQNDSGAVAIWDVNGTSAIATPVISNPGPLDTFRLPELARSRPRGELGV